LIETAASVAMVIGTLFVVLSALGLLRLPDVYCRTHAATKASTLGMAGLLGASALLFSNAGDHVLVELLAMAFILLTNPIGSHMVARSAYLTGTAMCSHTTTDELGQAGTEAGLGHDTE
jgi:multicomponent Na+:H+ antiporter subunit G